MDTTREDLFIAAAIQGFLANPSIGLDTNAENIAELAIDQAEWVLKKLNTNPIITSSVRWECANHGVLKQDEIIKANYGMQCMYCGANVHVMP